MSKQVPDNEGIPSTVSGPKSNAPDTGSDTDDNKLRSADEGFDRSILLGDGQNE